MAQLLGWLTGFMSAAYVLVEAPIEDSDALLAPTGAEL